MQFFSKLLHIGNYLTFWPLISNLSVRTDFRNALFHSVITVVRRASQILSKSVNLSQGFEIIGLPTPLLSIYRLLTKLDVWQSCWNVTPHILFISCLVNTYRNEVRSFNKPDNSLCLSLFSAKGIPHRKQLPKFFRFITGADLTSINLLLEKNWKQHIVVTQTNVMILWRRRNMALKHSLPQKFSF